MKKKLVTNCLPCYGYSIQSKCERLLMKIKTFCEYYSSCTWICILLATSTSSDLVNSPLIAIM